MRRNNIFRIIIVMLCTMFVCTAFSGCFSTSVSAEIESVAINVYGFDNGASEITIAKDDYQNEYDSLSVTASITWQQNINISKKLEVSWEFVGDDLGCKVSVIDPCCTSGTIARIRLGDETGKVILRATAKSKNTTSTDLVIWVGEEARQSRIGGLYNLTEAYEYEWLTDENLASIAHYYNNRYDEVIYPESLSEETALKVKQTYLEKFYPDLLIDFSGYDYLDIENPLDGVRIAAYYGTYNECVIVSVWDDFVCYDWPQTVDVTIGGVVFEDFWIREIFVWVYDSNKPQYVRTDYRYDFNLQTRELVIESREQLDEYNIRMIEACINSFDNFIQATKRYDEAFFKNNLLVFIVLAEGSGSIRHHVTGIDFYEQQTLINIEKYAPEIGTDDMAEWHIIVPLRRIDIKSKNFVASLPISPPIINDGLSRAEIITQLVGAFRCMNNFTGVWVHYTDNIEYLNVGLAVSQAEIDRLNATANYGGAVIYHRQNFTYSYLKKIMDSLSTAMSDYTIYSIGINESENQIDIYLNDEDKIGLIVSFLQENELYSMAVIKFNVDPNGGIVLN